MRSGYQAADAAIRVAEGNHRGALAAAERAPATKDALGIASQSVEQAFSCALEAALALGREDKADELLTVVEQLPPGLQPPFLAATAHRFRARLAGNDSAAEREFTAAATTLAEHELPFHLAVVQLEHGEWLVARGRSDDAEPLLAEARETFERLQAKPWLERLDAVSAGPTAEVPAEV